MSMDEEEEFDAMLRDMESQPEIPPGEVEFRLHLFKAVYDLEQRTPEIEIHGRSTYDREYGGQP
jgi:hypothetical protein